MSIDKKNVAPPGALDNDKSAAVAAPDAARVASLQAAGLWRTEPPTLPAPREATAPAHRRRAKKVPFGFRRAPSPPSPVHRRLIETGSEISLSPAARILYQHSAFTQVGLPYRDPGASVCEWDREQGRVALKISAGEARDPKTNRWLKLGIPFGPKARLILAYLNGEALRSGSPVIEVEDSLTAFVKRIGLSGHGRDIRVVKDQLARLFAAQIRMAISLGEDHARQVNAHIVAGFELWFAKNERQRVLWPTAVQLSLDYFESLQRHAVPLDERAVAALSHSAMGLDIYAWLAQRLHRVDPHRPQFIPWTALKDQFGQGYSRLRAFRAAFLVVLKAVTTQYPSAALEIDRRGLTLRNSAPPVARRLVAPGSRAPSVAAIARPS